MESCFEKKRKENSINIITTGEYRHQENINKRHILTIKLLKYAIMHTNHAQMFLEEYN